MIRPMVSRQLIANVGFALVATVLCTSCQAPEEIHDVPYDARYDATVLDLYLPDGDAAQRHRRAYAQTPE